MDEQEHARWLSNLQAVRGGSDKSGTAVFFLSLCGGFLGLDLFYLGKIGLGILKLLTFGGYGLWWLIDVVRICCGTMRDGNGGLVPRPFT